MSLMQLVGGFIFVLAGIVLLIGGSLLRNRRFSGCWSGTQIPVSRVGMAAWSIAVASWGVILWFTTSGNEAYAALAMICSFGLLVAAAQYDSWLDKNGR